MKPHRQAQTLREEIERQTQVMADEQSAVDQRAELIDMRDKLRAELERAQARLSTRRRWLSRSRRA